MQVQREGQVYESTLQKMNQQLQASLDLMAAEKAALQLSLGGLQHQFEGVAQAVYTADEAVVGQTPLPTLSVTWCTCCRSDILVDPGLSRHASAIGRQPPLSR